MIGKPEYGAAFSLGEDDAKNLVDRFRAEGVSDREVVARIARAAAARAVQSCMQECHAAAAGGETGLQTRAHLAFVAIAGVVAGVLAGGIAAACLFSDGEKIKMLCKDLSRMEEYRDRLECDKKRLEADLRNTGEGYCRATNRIAKLDMERALAKEANRKNQSEIAKLQQKLAFVERGGNASKVATVPKDMYDSLAATNSSLIATHQKDLFLIDGQVKYITKLESQLDETRAERDRIKKEKNDLEKSPLFDPKASKSDLEEFRSKVKKELEKARDQLEDDQSRHEKAVKALVKEREKLEDNRADFAKDREKLEKVRKKLAEKELDIKTRERVVEEKEENLESDYKRKESDLKARYEKVEDNLKRKYEEKMKELEKRVRMR